MFWFYTFVLLSLSISVYNQGTNNNFGPYKLNWLNIELCKGPKKDECGTVKLESIQNKSDIIILADFPRDCPATKAKISISNMEMNSKKKMWNYAVDSPCKHFVLAPVMNENFNLTEKHCKVDKGNYTVHVDMEGRTRLFLGSSFFYGTYSFRILSHNKNSNFFCMETVVAIQKP